MKKKIASNIFLSTALLGTLFVLDSFLEHSFLYHYIATGFFFVTYAIQQLLIFNIGTTPSSFIIVYNVTTMFKMFDKDTENHVGCYATEIRTRIVSVSFKTSLVEYAEK